MRTYTFRKKVEEYQGSKDLTSCLRNIGSGPFFQRIDKSGSLDANVYLIRGFLWDNVVEAQTILNSEGTHSYAQVYATGISKLVGDKVNLRLTRNLKRLGYSQA